MEQLLNQTFKVDNTEVSAYHLTDERQNNFKIINARWDAENLSIYTSADFNQYNIICSKHPEAANSTRTKVFISFINKEKNKIETKYILDTCDYYLRIPRLDIDSFATRNVYQLFQDSKGYFETLAALETLLANNPKMDQTTALILNYTLNQMRTESPDYHSCPEFLDKLISVGYSKKHKNPFIPKSKE